MTRKQEKIDPAELHAPSNGILSALPQSRYEPLASSLRPVRLRCGQVLMEQGQTLDSVYFLNSGVISLVLSSDEGTDVEVGLVGCDGAVDSGVALTTLRLPYDLVVQAQGIALEMPLQVFCDEFVQGGVFQDRVLRHMQVVAYQSSIGALCNRLHSVEQRLARWLLLMHDMVQSNELPLTQAFIAHMLGTRRSGVTIAAGTLSAAGLIRYARGCITIVNRQGLEDASCECYRRIHAQSEMLLG